MPELLPFQIMKVPVFVVVLLVLVQSALPEAYPFNCRCTKYKIFCRDSRMRSLPQGSPTTTLVSMKGDVLSTLNQSVVSKPGLGNLTTLELIGTNINVIQSHAFVEMKELESLTIIKNNVSDLQPGAFLVLDKLIKLDLSRNELTHLRSGVFEGLFSLKYLNLSYNFIREIHSGVFDGLRWVCITINIIDLSRNRISRVEDETFRGLCSLKSLRVGIGDDRPSLSVNLNSLFSLRSLEISAIYFEYNRQVRVTMRSLFNLRHIKIIYISLPKIQNRFLVDSKFLKKLSITYSRVKELELGCFQRLQSLSELNLSHNRVSSIPEGVFQDLQSLQKLDLSGNSLQMIKRNMFMGPTRLRILDLTENPISSVEGNAFSKLPYLRELLLFIQDFHFPYDVQHRSFAVIDRIDSEAFSGLLSLKSLHLPYCSQRISTNVTLQSLQRLDSFQGPKHFSPENLQVAKNLTFSISGDLMRSNINRWFRTVIYLKQPVSLEMYYLKSLEVLEMKSGFPIYSLFVQNCKVCIIGKNSLIGFSELHSLKMYTTRKIQVDRGAFSATKALQNMHLHSETGFNIAPGVFKDIPMLKKLVVVCTRLTQKEGFVPRTNQLRGLINLKELTLRAQNIKSLGEAIFLQLEDLEELDLSKNSISILVHGQFKGLRKLKSLDLSQNIISNLSVGAFQDLRSIEVISLFGNQIENIGAGVFGAICGLNFTLNCANLTQFDKYCNTSFALGTLTTLRMDNNRIKFIDKDAFLGCDSLKILVLERNVLHTPDFLFTPQLTHFSVSANISEISNDTFACTPMMINIRLLFIDKLSMHVNALKHLKYLKYIYVSQIKYNCKLREMWLYLRSRDITYRISYQNGTSIDSMLSQLKCNSSTDDTTQPRNKPSKANGYMYFKIYIEPIVFIFIFLSGCFGNGLLLFIVFSHSDMRNRNNTCVAHLAFSDILSLVLNLSLSYWDVLHVNWDLGETTCKIFITSKDLVVALVVFSVVALTFERYLVVQSFNKLKSPHGNSARPIVFLVIVWMYALVSSIPSYFQATVEGRCLSSLPSRHDYVQSQWTFQLLINCILPVVAIISLNLLSAYTLKKSSREVPGKIRNQSRDTSRNTVANLVMVLSVVFTLSSLPNFLLRTLVSWSVWSFEEVFWFSFVTYCLFFFHTIFNPFALFVMGSKYKSHIKEYVRFFIKEREHVPTSPDVKKQLENACDVLQKFGQRLAGTHHEEDAEEPDDIDARVEAVRRARQERLNKLQTRFL